LKFKLKLTSELFVGKNKLWGCCFLNYLQPIKGHWRVFMVLKLSDVCQGILAPKEAFIEFLILIFF